MILNKKVFNVLVSRGPGPQVKVFSDWVNWDTAKAELEKYEALNAISKCHPTLVEHHPTVPNAVHVVEGAMVR